MLKLFPFIALCATLIFLPRCGVGLRVPDALSVSTLSIRVDTSNPIALGSTVRLYATALLRGGETVDVTSHVRWTNSDATVAIVKNEAPYKGYVLAIGAGTTQVNAELNSVTTSTSLQISSGGGASGNGSSGSVGPQIKMIDTFTGTNGDDLSAHSMDFGTGSWTPITGTWQIQNNKAKVVTVALGEYHATTNPGKANISVRAVATSGGATGSPGLMLRYTDANNYFLFAADAGNNLVHIYRIQGGVGTSLGNVAFTFSTNPHLYEFKVSGDNFKGYLDGNEVLSATDSFNNTETKVGLRDHPNAGGDNSSFDSFTVIEE